MRPKVRKSAGINRMSFSVHHVIKTEAHLHRKLWRLRIKHD